MLGVNYKIILDRKWKKIDQISSLADTTKDTYHSYMRSLYQFSDLENEIQFLETSDEKLQELLEKFLDFLKSRVKSNEISPNTVPKLFKAYKVLLDVNYREHAISWKPIALQYPKKEKRSGYKPWTTKQIRMILSVCNSFKKTAAIHFQASTGGRVGVHNHSLLMKHMIKMETSNLDYHCYAILIYAESDETVFEKDQRILNTEQDEEDYSFFVFLTPEASKSLDEYHSHRKIHYKEVFNQDTPIFMSVNTHGLPDKDLYYQMSGNAFRHMMEDLLSQTPIQRIKKRNRYDVMIDHGYRKRFNTILKLENEVNSNIAEKLMQHKKGLDGTYLTPTRKECFTEFKKAIPELTVDPTERQRLVIQKKEEEITELQSTKEINIDLQKQFDEIKNRQEEFERKWMEVSFPGIEG